MKANPTTDRSPKLSLKQNPKQNKMPDGTVSVCTNFFLHIIH